MAAKDKPSQILQLNPPTEILFEGPFDRVVTSYLELNNPSNATICFKVKTTAPRRYCVRPNSGTIEAGCKVRIAIMLQPQQDETPNERFRHKFMVQSTIFQSEIKNLDSVWQNLSPEQIMDSKLRCVFESPKSNTATEPKPNIAIAAISENTNKTTEFNTADSTSKTSPATNSLTQQETLTEPKQTAGDGQNTSKTRENKSFIGGFAPTPSSTAPLRKIDAYDANKSVASSNLTVSFLQPMSDDYKIVLVSLAMLFIGVILGKYII